MKSTFKNVLYDSSLFRIFFFVNLFLGSFMLLDAVAIGIDGIMMIWAGFIFKKQMKNNSLKNVEYNKIILLFLASALFTTLLHAKMSFPLYLAFDFIMIYHYAICLLLLYGLAFDIEASKQKISNEILTVFKIVAYTTVVITFISFIILLFNEKITIYKETKFLGTINYEIGIYQRPGIKRLTGVYSNPNILAFCSVLSIIFTHALIESKNFLRKHSSLFKFICAICFFAINLAALILSDSIASIVFLFFYLLFTLIYKIFFEKKSRSLFTLTVKIASFLLIATGFALALLILKGDLQTSFSKFISLICPSYTGTFGRENYDLSYGSGRKVLLEQAMIIFQHNPVFGVGISNIWKYGQIYFEDGIAFPNFILGMSFPNFHNGYLTILACYGAIGFLLFLTFIFLSLKNIVKQLVNKCNTNSMFPCISAAICAYLVYALFEKTFLSEINFMGVTFWLLLGYATYLSRIQDGKS